MNLAIFDLDNTLLDGDSDYNWGLYLVKKGYLDKGEYKEQNQKFFEEYQLGKLDIFAFAEFQFQFLKNNPRFQENNLKANIKITENFRILARELGSKSATLAIAWILHQGNNIITIPGTRSVSHLKELASGGSLKLKKTELQEIEKILSIGWCHGDRYSVDQWIGPEKFC